MLADALEVTSVAQAGLRAVLDIVVQAGNLSRVVRTLGEAVGHQKIEDVGVRETFVFLASLLAFAQLIADDGLILRVRAAEGDGQFPCVRVLKIKV